jgi:hypothetical protein
MTKIGQCALLPERLAQHLADITAQAAEERSAT